MTGVFFVLELPYVRAHQLQGVITLQNVAVPAARQPMRVLVRRGHLEEVEVRQELLTSLLWYGFRLVKR